MRAPGTRKQAPKRLLGPREKAALQREIRECEIQMTTPDMVGVGQWMPGAPHARTTTAAQRLAFLKRQLEAGSVEDLSRYKVQQREKRIKELEERCKSRMAPRGHYFAKQEDSTDFNKTVEHLEKVELSPQHSAEVLELKNLLRARSAAESRLGGSKEKPDCASTTYLRG